MPESQEDSSLSDDLFNAAFDEAVKGEVSTDPPETKVDSASEPEVKLEPEAKVEPEVTKVETAAPVDISAIIAATVAATRVKEEPVKEVDTPAAPTAAELAAEEQYKKDWPEQYAREQRLKAQLDEVKNLLATTTEALKGQIAPVLESANVSAEEKHLATIYTAHPDADAILPGVEKWISEQPKFLQPRFNDVLEKGAAADVVELFSTYKKTLPAVADTSSADADADAARIEAEKNERLSKMKTPTSIRTSVTAEDDATDFDSAFDQEAKKYKMVA